MPNLFSQTVESQQNFTISPCDSIQFVQSTNDGGYIVASGYSDYIIVKINANGSTQWQHSYGGSSLDRLNTIIETSDGGYLLAGYSYSSDGNISGNYGYSDYWIVKTNSSGVFQWEQNYGGASYETLTDVIATNDGGYLLTGTSRSSDGNVGGNNGNDDYWIVKTDAVGALQWEKNYGGSNSDGLVSAKQTSDGGYLLGGHSNSSDGNVSSNNGGYDYWIVKINSFGTLQWEKNYGGSSSETCSNIAETNDGGFIIGGSSSSSDGNVGGNNGGRDYWIVKTNSSGVLQWEQNYGSANNETLLAVQEMSDDGFLLLGNYNINDVIKTNAFGTVQWSQSYGSSNYYISSATETNDADFLLTSHDNCDVMIQKIIDNSVLCSSNARIEAEAGDVYVDESCYGLILTAPDGSCFRVRVTTNGTLTIDPVVCP